MFQWYREKQEKKLKDLRDQIKQEIVDDARRKEEESRPQLTRMLSEEAEKYRDSIEPWVTIVGETMSDEGIKIELDWNDAFVKYLKAQGVAGTDDTQIVQKWLAMIAYQTSDNLGQNRLELEGKTNEYE